MSIRPARDEDFSAIASITNHCIETTSIHFGTEPVRDDELRAHWQASRERPSSATDQSGVSLRNPCAKTTG